MTKKFLLWGAIVILIGAGIFLVGRLSTSSLPTERPPAYSLSLGPMAMVSGGAGYVFDDYNYTTGNVLSTKDLTATIQRYLDQIGNPDLAVARLREFRWAYQAEIVERSTGRHAFGLMLGKGTSQLSPKAGPNVFWNNKYGSLIAEVGGGYGMLGRLLTQDTSTEMPISDTQAREIALSALQDMNTGLELTKDMTTFYGFYEFRVSQNGELIGEVDVNGYSGQVWFKDWGEQQIEDYELITTQ